MLAASIKSRFHKDSDPSPMKELFLSAYLDALPGEVCVEDLHGNLVYTNAMFHHHEDDRHHDIPSSTVIHFPLTNQKGETIGSGSFRQIPTDRVDEEVLRTLKKNLGVVVTPPPPPPPVPFEDGKEEGGDGDGDDDDDDSHTESIPLGKIHHSPQPHQNYQLLFHKLPMGAALNEIVTDEDNKPIDWIFREVNPALEQYTGLKASDIIGRRASECIPGIEKDPADWVGHFGKVALGGETFRYDRQYDTSLQKWYDGMAYQPVHEDGHFVCLFRDVSDRVYAEENLRESEERHRHLFESMMQGVVYQEASGNIIATNPSAERILGLTLDQMMGRTSVDPRWKSIREDGSDFPGDQHPSMQALKTGKPVTGVLMGVFHPLDEKHHWIIIDAIPRFRPGETEPFQVCSTFTDMTQTKEFERRLLQEKDRAEMADRLKSAFLANVSHEIRTPLNGIIGHIDLALSNDLEQEFRQENRDGLHVAKQSGELLTSIIQDILDLSKIEAGQLDIEHDGHFMLRDLVDRVASLGETLITKNRKAISFEHTIEGNVHNYALGDVFRIQQVLNNLVSNAIKFTDTGKVNLTVIVTKDNMLEFSVCDTGKGIPPEHQESIF